ncbi:MAG: flagellar basal body rod protein FlgB [Myxococcota bacterium]
MSGFLFDPSFSGVHRVLDLRQQQHTLTATNLANANTPAFKARFLDFREALTEAVTASPDAGPIEPETIEVEAPAWSTSGNSVNPEQEHARLRANSVQYQGALRGLSRRLAILKFAAADGRA